MNCPKCNNKNTRVIDTRARSAGSVQYRRYKCESCGEVFNSYEYQDVGNAHKIIQHILEIIRLIK